jgi:hypothetical protein
MLMGKTCTVNLYFNLTITAVAGYFYFILPSGVFTAGYSGNSFPYSHSVDGRGSGMIQGAAAANASVLYLYRVADGAVNWSVGTIQFVATHAFQIV